MSAALVDFPYLIDLALGTPESGTVNFNVLHALLHSIVHLLNFENVRIELIDIPISKPETGEFALTADTNKTIVEEFDGNKNLLDVEKVIRVQKAGKGISIEENKIRMSAGACIQRPKSICHITKEKQLNSKIEEILNIAKRSDQADNRFSEMERKLKELQKKYENLNKTVDEMRDNIKFDKTEELDESKGHKVDSKDNIEQDVDLDKSLDEMRDKLNFNKFEKLNELKTRKMDSKDKIDRDARISPTQAPYKEVINIEEVLRNLKNDIDQIKQKIHQYVKGSEEEKQVSSRTNKGEVECSSSFEFNIEKECNHLMKILNHKLELLSAKFLTLNDRTLDIEKVLCELSENVESMNLAKDGRSSQITIMDLHNKISNIENFVMETINKLQIKIGESSELESRINGLTQDLEKISNSKIDKGYIEDLLADKVDYDMLQRKVSVDDFDITKRDLESLMWDTLRKIQERDDDWCKTMQFFKKELDLKLNAVEITALRQNFEKRFQHMNHLITSLHSKEADPEAAGTHTKMLKDLSCISCNRCVLMRAEEKNKVPQLKPLLGQKSLKPYLTYELDVIRKQMKEPGKNMHHLETILKGGDIMDNKIRQICNRYCGGSHTIITAEDRVKRTVCKRMKKVKAECICEKPIESPPCPCPEEKEDLEICKCPSEPEVCPCPSDDDPLDKCASARRKRCADIERQRHKICKKEEKHEICKDKIGSRLNVESCKQLRRKVRECNFQNQIEKTARCHKEPKTYNKFLEDKKDSEMPGINICSSTHEVRSCCNDNTSEKCSCTRRKRCHDDSSRELRRNRQKCNFKSEIEKNDRCQSELKKFDNCKSAANYDVDKYEFRCIKTDQTVNKETCFVEKSLKSSEQQKPCGKERKNIEDYKPSEEGFPKEQIEDKFVEQSQVNTVNVAGIATYKEQKIETEKLGKTSTEQITLIDQGEDEDVGEEQQEED